MQQFYMKLRLSNLYKESNQLENNNLPGIHMKVNRHIDHIMGSKGLCKALVSDTQ